MTQAEQFLERCIEIITEMYEKKNLSDETVKDLFEQYEAIRLEFRKKAKEYKLEDQLIQKPKRVILEFF